MGRAAVRSVEMRLTELGSTPGDDALERAIETRLGDLDPGKYHRNNAFVLRQFAQYLREEEVGRVEEVTPEVLRGYARVLREAVEADTIAASTAEQYWAVVSAFLGWSVREGLLGANPARLRQANEPLPESDGRPSRQFWTPRDRKAICATADRVVDETLGEGTEREQLAAFRDRALVYTLAYTGCRGAELAAVPGDPKRNGVAWADVNLAEGVVTVYGKTRTSQEAPVFEPAVDPLRRWGELLEPEPDWPVFPSGHLPSLYRRLPNDVDTGPGRVWDDLRAHGCRPPSVTTEGVRRVLRRLCEESPYEFSEPLRPHGARRGLGDELYREQAELAQDALRHRNIETTHASYREERVQRVKERGDEILE